MRKITILLLLALTLPLLAADKKESLESLKQRAEEATDGKQAELLLDVARRQTDNADKLFDSGDTENAKAAIKDAADYIVRAMDTARTTRKKMKQIEIGARKISRRLEAIRRNVSFDDRPPVADAIARLEKARSALLAEMFRK